MNGEKLETKNKTSLTESEMYRLVKWVGLNGGLLGPCLKMSIENNDYGWLLLPGVLTAVTTPVVTKLFKKINKCDLLRILGTWAKVTGAIAPISLAFIAVVRSSMADTANLREFSVGQVAEFSIVLTATLFFIDFWIESQMKISEGIKKGHLTDESNGSPITKGLVTMMDNLLDFPKKWHQKFRIKGK